jgi:riboflavin synthase
MFTGLVQAMGEVLAVEPKVGGGARVRVRPRGWDYSPSSGDSICVSGCCLTLAEELRTQGGAFAFDAVPETLAKTTLGSLKPGDAVNLERSLSASDLMGGHLVQGHIEGLGTVTHVQTGADWRLAVRAPAELMPCIAPKGSITVDGVSLTVASVDAASDSFEIALIPTTLERTTLSRLKPGDRCNLETDIVARTVVHYLRHYGR